MLKLNNSKLDIGYADEKRVLEFKDLILEIIERINEIERKFEIKKR